MMKINYFLWFFILNSYLLLVAQGKTTPKDSLYFENWIGNWYETKDGINDSVPKYKVSQALYPNSYEEIWDLNGNIAKAWRAWDSETHRWEFVWMSEMGEMQIWNCKIENGIFYLFRNFQIKDKNIISRHSFYFEDEDTLLRTSEQSIDGGITWRMRSRKLYKKM